MQQLELTKIPPILQQDFIQIVCFQLSQVIIRQILFSNYNYSYYLILLKNSGDINIFVHSGGEEVEEKEKLLKLPLYLRIGADLPSIECIST